MNILSRYTAPGLIVPELRSRDAEGAVGELCSLLHHEGWIKELLPFYNEILRRESVSSSALPPNWALPHARMSGLERLVFALGRTSEPLIWFGNGLVSVDLVFLFAVPENESAAYLGLISGIAKLSHDRAQLERLLQAPDQQGMFEILEGREFADQISKAK